MSRSKKASSQLAIAFFGEDMREAWTREVVEEVAIKCLSFVPPISSAPALSCLPYLWHHFNCIYSITLLKL